MSPPSYRGQLCVARIGESKGNSGIGFCPSLRKTGLRLTNIYVRLSIEFGRPRIPSTSKSEAITKEETQVGADNGQPGSD